jgi:hypothetical protein
MRRNLDIAHETMLIRMQARINQGLELVCMQGLVDGWMDGRMDGCLFVTCLLANNID